MGGAQPHAPVKGLSPLASPLFEGAKRKGMGDPGPLLFREQAMDGGDPGPLLFRE
jgi:hypothetical protein